MLIISIPTIHQQAAFWQVKNFQLVFCGYANLSHNFTKLNFVTSSLLFSIHLFLLQYLDLTILLPLLFYKKKSSSLKDSAGWKMMSLCTSSGLLARINLLL